MSARLASTVLHRRDTAGWTDDTCGCETLLLLGVDHFQRKGDTVGGSKSCRGRSEHSGFSSERDCSVYLYSMRNGGSVCRGSPGCSSLLFPAPSG